MSNKVIGEYRFVFRDERLDKTKALSSTQEDKDMSLDKSSKTITQDEGTGSLSGLIAAGYLTRQILDLQNSVHSMQMSALTNRVMVTGDTHSLKIAEVRQQRLRKGIEVSSKAGMAGIIGNTGIGKWTKPNFSMEAAFDVSGRVPKKLVSPAAIMGNIVSILAVAAIAYGEIKKYQTSKEANKLYTTQHKIESYSAELANRRLVNMTGAER